MDVPVSFVLIPIGILTYLLFDRCKNKKMVKYPPGPRFSFPYLGHLPMLGNEPYKKVMRWKQNYGPLIFAKLGSYPAIFVNDIESVHRIFERPEFAKRARMHHFGDTSEAEGFTFNEDPDSEEQREFVADQMKFFGHLRTLFEDNIKYEVETFVLQLEKRLGERIKLRTFFDVPIINSIWTTVMGRRLEFEDPQLQELLDSIPTLCPMDGFFAKLAWFIPRMAKVFPNSCGYRWKKGVPVDNFELIEAALNQPLFNDRMKGDPKSMRETWLNIQQDPSTPETSSFKKNILPRTVSNIFTEALETVGTSLEWIFLYLATFDEVHQKFQREIDANLGRHRIPRLIDRPSMPYTQALILEFLRYSSPTPFNGLFHCATEDTTYEEYEIPKDTLIIANAYAIHHDPEVWREPEEFRPERFLNEKGQVDPRLAEKVIPFSYGSRKCLGERAARDQIFLFMVSVMQRYDIKCTVAKPSLKGRPGIIRAPLPYEFVFTARAPQD